MLLPPNATALLQVLQAKSTEGHAWGWSRSGSSERALYRATSEEVSGSCDVHTCGPGAPPLAVSGWHRDADKFRFLKVPVSQTGLFGDAAGNMAQQFPAAQDQVPAFHLAALPPVRRWSWWSPLYGVWVPGAHPSHWLLRTFWLGYAIQFARRPPKFRGIHLTAVKAADAHILWEESLSYWRRTWWNRSLQPIWRKGFSAFTSLCPRKAVG